MCIAFSKIALHRIGKTKTQRMGRYDGFTLKKKIRDSRTDEAPRPHSSTRLFLALVVQCKRLVPSLRHRGILCRQDCTPMKAAHPFSHTPVQLHTHKAAHSFSCTPVAKVLHCSCQNVTRLTALTALNPNGSGFIVVEFLSPPKRYKKRKFK